MRMQHGLVLLSVLILGACTTPADIPPARMHAPSVWSAAVPVVVDADPTPAWWMVLGDDTLNVWIEHAMRDSADLQVLLARLEQAQAWADAKAAARAPSFGVQVSVAHERTSQMDLHHPDGSRTDTPPAWQRRLGGDLKVAMKSICWGVCHEHNERQSIKRLPVPRTCVPCGVG